MKSLVIDGINSRHSKDMYGKAIDDFLTWREAQGGGRLIKALVQSYKAYLLEATDYAPSTINLRLSANRKLAREAACNGVMDPAFENGVQNVESVTTSGVRIGNWLTLDQAQLLIRTADKTTLKGQRDRAILAIMIGGGLHRSEVAKLTMGHIRIRQARWVFVDLVDKQKQSRSVPVPAWTKAAVDDRTTEANIQEDKVFRPINKGDKISSPDMTPQAVADVVRLYAEACGFHLAAHDLRRTYANLAKSGGADMVQIQLSLGHARIQTTERYLNTDQDLTSAPCDRIHLQLSWKAEP